MPRDPAVTVGPLFAGRLDHAHGCTASVLDSPGRDLVLTAAHCVSGTGRQLSFVPGYRSGRAPYGVWRVTAAYTDPAWLASHDPDADYAILRVADRDGSPTAIEDVTGGNVLGSAPRSGQRITVLAYDKGVNDLPVRCETTVYDTAGQPSFDCPRFASGSSGGPWLVTSTGGVTVVRGVIGGLHRGGCSDGTSYTAVFSRPVFRLLARAGSDAAADTVIPAGSDC